MTLGRVAELAFLLGKKAVISFPEMVPVAGQNIETSRPALRVKTDYAFEEKGEETPESDFEFNEAA
ncbi:hypothetical protein CQ14_07040 [Bradyrhizobium lablabi]|uniref:Uncharacterized protein n=2 Tax=Bradyrhizobium lablabi TaxID=722472 RepID=A0A0R3MTU5_9BRAD|nr:hypothetical protein CQ14_07040 [Bradyrhizobium lablabi]